MCHWHRVFVGTFINTLSFNNASTSIILHTHSNITRSIILVRQKRANISISLFQWNIYTRNYVSPVKRWTHGTIFFPPRNNLNMWVLTACKNPYTFLIFKWESSFSFLYFYESYGFYMLEHDGVMGSAFDKASTWYW